MKNITTPYQKKACLMCHKGFAKNPKESRLQWEGKMICSTLCPGGYLAKLPERNKKIAEKQRGSKNSHWKGGVNHCVVCKKPLNYSSIHCKTHQPPNNWKGENASYYAIHAWVARHRGRPQKCEHCGTTKFRRYHWANKSRKYKRELSDWIRLCVPCHRKYDSTDTKY